MILLKKINNEDDFVFDKILKKGYEIKEQPNLINKKQFANGRRKKIITTYTDVVIKINLGCFDGNTLAEYIDNLKDGEYQYYSLNDKTMKNANFIVTLPSFTIENSANEIVTSDFEAVLEKSGEVI